MRDSHNNSNTGSRPGGHRSQRADGRGRAKSRSDRDIFEHPRTAAFLGIEPVWQVDYIEWPPEKAANRSRTFKETFGHYNDAWSFMQGIQRRGFCVIDITEIGSRGRRRKGSD